MAISKIILNGTTQMDVTGKTVTSADMLNGVTALKNDGTDITGSISAMTLPSASSATSSGTSKATITPTSSAQYLNIPAGYLDTAQYYTIAAASGGASNIVTGTFTGTTTGQAMDVNLSYTGSGYPIAVMIFPKEGAYNSSTGSWYSLIQRYAIGVWCGVKCTYGTAPTYQTTGEIDNQMTICGRFKSSSSNATSYTSMGSSNASILQNENAIQNQVTCVKLKNATTMSVFIANTSYGFAANIEYRYFVIYSS